MSAAQLRELEDAAKALLADLGEACTELDSALLGAAMMRVKGAVDDLHHCRLVLQAAERRYALPFDQEQQSDR